MGIFFAFLSALSFCISNLLVKKGMGHGKLDGNQGYFVTLLCNNVLLGFIFLFTLWFIKGFHFQFSWIGTLFFVLSGLLTTGFGRLTNYMAIRRIGPSRSSAIKNGSSIFTLLFAILILGETMNWWQGLGIGLILLGIILQGIVLIRSEDNRTNEANSDKKGFIVSYKVMGYIIIVLSSISFGVGYGFRKQAILFLNDAFFGALIGAMTSLLFFLIYEGIKGQVVSTVRNGLTLFNPYYLFAGVLTSLGPLFFFLGITFTQVSFVSVVAASEPLLTVLVSYLFFKREEKLSISIWITAILVLFGTVVIILTA